MPIFVAILVTSLLGPLIQCCESQVTGGSWDYIIVGAGPAGLQMGYYLERANRSYVILEKESVPGM